MDKPQRHPFDFVDRAQVLELLSEQLTAAWTSFDRPRSQEAKLSAALTERLAVALPEVPGDPQQSLADAAQVLDASVSPSRPLYAAYIGSTGLEAGVLAGALTNAYDVNLAASAGAAELLEQQTLRWMAEFIGYPLRGGTFTSGGMTSNLTALTAAREAALPGARLSGVAGRAAAVYCSAEAHHSVVRAVEVIGLGSDAVRRLPIDENRQMRVEALAETLAQDRRAGVVPVAVVATAGTTLTGAIDPLAQIADLCAEHEVWMHVDAAYGGPAAAVPGVSQRFAGLERADSVTVDAHKWMGVQKSCSLVMVSRSGALERAFAHNEGYMPHAGVASNAVDGTLEYSRPVRSLKLWMAFRIYGAAALRGWIADTLQHARHLAQDVEADPRFELLIEPSLSVVCFRHLGGDDVQDVDEHNMRLARAVAQDGRVYLAPAVVDGRTYLRACFTNFRTTADHISELLRVIAEIGDGL